MRSGIRRGKRRKNKGLLLILSGILAVFAIIIIAVGIKFALSGWSVSGGKDKEEKEEEKNKVLITDIQLDCEKPVVRVGEKLQLQVNLQPEDATDKELVWTVSGEMGTVDEQGMFIPAAEAAKSDVEVTATAKDGTDVSAKLTIRVLEAIDPTKPMVAITYDDGPHKTNTPKILDVLEKNYAVATFFLVGQNIEGKEDIVKRTYSLGSEIASHTWNHANLSNSSTETINKQLNDTDAAIKAVVNVENPILRPPYGAFNDKVKEACGKPIIMWSVDTLDWKTRSADSTYDSCMTAKDGDIILMHDIHECSAIAAEDIIPDLQAKGFQLVTVTELYTYRQGEFGPGKVNYSMSAEEYNKIIAEQETATEETTAEETE